MFDFIITEEGGNLVTALEGEGVVYVTSFLPSGEVVSHAHYF